MCGAFLREGAGLGAAVLIAVPFLANAASAAPAGAKVHAAAPAARAFSAPRIGPSGGHSFGAPRIGPIGGHAFHAPRIAGSATARFSGPANFRNAAAKFASGPALRGSFPHKFATAAAVSHPARLGAHPGAWNRHGLITNTAFRSSFIRPRTFSGRFHGSYWPWWTGGIVIGWVGPVFWPYAYYDFFDYVFWPYVYDDFWVYAYEDVYYGIYGNYGYVDPALKTAAHRPAVNPEQRTAGVCGEKAPELTNWPIERISEVIEPSEMQRVALAELKEATSKAIDLLRAACPNDLPSVPTGRLAAMDSRLTVMLEAVRTVRTPLDRLYQTLADEQKARFNAMA